jgi:hypothetical protein
MRRPHLVTIAALAAAASALSGCIHDDGEYRRRLAEGLRPVHAIGIVSPLVKVYELDAGGMRVLRDAWSEQGRQNVAEALGASLGEKGLRVRPIEAKPQTREELEEVRLLYEAVGQAILDARGMYLYKPGFLDRDYSVGPVDRLLSHYGVDALALTYASDEISTGGRKVKAALAGLIGVEVRGGISWASIALVNRTGRVIWFADHAAESSYDLRDQESTQVLVRSLITSMPVGEVP